MTGDRGARVPFHGGAQQISPGNRLRFAAGNLRGVAAYCTSSVGTVETDQSFSLVRADFFPTAAPHREFGDHR
jgi:hypothetical protein